MSDHEEALQPPSTSIGQPSRSTEPPRISAPEVEDIPRSGEDVYLMRNVPAPSIPSDESSMDAQPPDLEQRHWFLRLLGWLLVYLWALTQVSLTGVQQRPRTNAAEKFLLRR